MSVDSSLRASGLSPEQIARRSGLSEDRVAAILAGHPPSMRELRALAAGLQVPLSFFSSRKDEAAEALGMQFRSGAASRDELDHSVRKVATFVASALQILPARPYPPEILRFSEPLRNSSNIRSYLGYHDDLDQLFDLPIRVSRLEGVIFSLINRSRFEGISTVEGNYLFIFVSPRFAPRMLFTLAHELGHAVNGDLSGGEAIFDLAGEIGNIRRSKVRERKADLFASDLLLPEVALARFLGELRGQLGISIDEPLGDIEIIYLSRFFGLSFDAAAMRCEHLGLLPKGGAFSLSSHIKVHHGSPEKRAEALGIPRRPLVAFPRLSGALVNALSRALEGADVSAGWVAENFDISISQLLELRKMEHAAH